MRAIVLLLCVFLVLKEGASEPLAKCVPIKECPSLIVLLMQNPMNTEVRDFLIKSTCGYTVKQPKVWCKSDYKACLTADGQEGTCENYKTCPDFQDRLRNLNLNYNEELSFVSQYECKYVFEPGTKVCCPSVRIETNALALKPNGTETPILELPKEESTPSTPFPVDLTSNLVLFTSPDLATSSLRPNLLSNKEILPDPSQDQCGRERLKFRITTSDIVDIDDFPWLAIIKYRSSSGISQQCQGVLINSRYILTAAHCVDESAQILEGVILGEYDTRNATDCVYFNNVADCASPVQDIKIEDVLIFPNRDEPFYHDIALVRLQRNAVFNDFVKPICLSTEDIATKDANFTIVGWRQTDNAAKSAVKRKVDVTTVPKDECNLIYRRALKQEQLCLGSPTKDSCTSSSGSPVMKLLPVNGYFVWHLVGIVSLGINNPCGKYPGVYTYIPPYVKWIRENIRD